MLNKKRNDLSIYRPFKSILDDFEDDFKGLWSKWKGMDEPVLNNFIPVIDVTEEKDKYIVKAEVPGLSKEEVKLTLRDKELIISGEKKTENEEKKKGYYYSERAYGSFCRRIPLSNLVMSDNIKAKYEKGVVEIELPKNKEVEDGGKEIAIE